MDAEISMRVVFRSVEGVFTTPLRLSKLFWNRQNALLHLPYHVHVFISASRYDCLNAIFLLYPSLVNARYMGRTPLHKAVTCEFSNIMVSYLLLNKASVNMKTYTTRQTALHMVFTDWGFDMRATVSDLLHSGADTNAIDLNRQSVLMYCLRSTCIMERPWIAEELLEYGADPFHTTKSRTTGKEICVVDLIDDRYTLEIFEKKVFAKLDAIGIGYSSSPDCPFGNLHEDAMNLILNFTMPNRVPICPV